MAALIADVKATSRCSPSINVISDIYYTSLAGEDMLTTWFVVLFRQFIHDAFDQLKQFRIAIMVSTIIVLIVVVLQLTLPLTGRVSQKFVEFPIPYGRHGALIPISQYRVWVYFT